MADQQSRGGKKQRKQDRKSPEQHQGVRAPAGTAGDEAEKQAERDRQNRDDPSRAPESGDRK